VPQQRLEEGILAQKQQEREGAIDENNIQNKENRPADSGLLIPAQNLGKRGAQWKRDQQECCLAM
jgi:hypothetical protein